VAVQSARIVETFCDTLKLIHGMRPAATSASANAFSVDTEL